MKKNLIGGAVLVAEVVGAAALFAGVNAAKSNSVRGTYAVGAKADGTGGVDLDLAAGAALLLLSAVAPSALSSHAAALGAGALSCFAAREGAQAGAKRAADAQINAGASYQAVAGSLSQYQPNQFRGLPVQHVPVDSVAASFANLR